jgi:peroxiredoxin
VAYGAQKGPDEQYPDFPKRHAYLIDPNGVIRKAYEVKDVAAHAGEVLDDLAALRGA